MCVCVRVESDEGERVNAQRSTDPGTTRKGRKPGKAIASMPESQEGPVGRNVRK